MAGPLQVGILAFHGDVSEHVWATEVAAKNLKLDIAVSLVRTRAQAENLDALIIPGGESTTLYKLMRREGMLQAVREIPAIMGTCAGAILLAKKITNPAEDQQSLGLMDITVMRNSYGRQDHSFETELTTPFGQVSAAFIRAPRMTSSSPEVQELASQDEDLVACEQFSAANYYLALSFHPELTTALFHEHFLRSLTHKLQ